MAKCSETVFEVLHYFHEIGPYKKPQGGRECCLLHCRGLGLLTSSNGYYRASSVWSLTEKGKAWLATEALMRGNQK